MKELLTLQEACEYLRIKRMTLYQMLWDGKVPGYKVGRLWRFDKDDLKSYFKKQMKSYYTNRKNKQKGRRG